MGASNHDIALTIVSGGKQSYFSSVKAAGTLIWDVRLGLFSGKVPEAWNALGFIAGSIWDDWTLCLDKPLPSPIYGSVTIDFDQKVVKDANTWGSSDEAPLEWLSRSVDDAIAGYDGLLSGPSLLEHLQCGRVQLMTGAQPYGRPLQFANLVRARDALRSLQRAALSSGRIITSARIRLPAGWQLVRVQPGL